MALRGCKCTCGPPGAANGKGRTRGDPTPAWGKWAEARGRKGSTHKSTQRRPGHSRNSAERATSEPHSPVFLVLGEGSVKSAG